MLAESTTIISNHVPCHESKPLMRTRLVVQVAVVLIAGALSTTNFVNANVHARTIAKATKTTSYATSAPSGSLAVSEPSLKALEPVCPMPSSSSSSISIGKDESKKPNVVLQLFGYVKSSVVRTVDGCGQLWSNHGRCKEIRQKMQVRRNELRQVWQDSDEFTPERKQYLKNFNGAGAISFEEYMFLQKGKEDRSKLMSLMFLMSGAPRFLPYALMLNPDMLPSPFQAGGAGSSESASPFGGAAGAVETPWVKLSRERSRAVVECLLNIEQQAKVVPALAKFNFFGKKGQEQKMQTLEKLSKRMATFLESAPIGGSTVQFQEGARRILTQLDPWLYQMNDPFTRSQERLCHVPAVVVKGICNMVGGQIAVNGLLGKVQPLFLTRGRLLGHLKNLEAADEFLVQADVDLRRLSKSVLMNACSDRLCACPTSSKEELTENLDQWLSLTVRQPADRLQAVQEQAAAALLQQRHNSASDLNGESQYDDENEQQEEPDVSVAESPELFYNGNLARMALMGYYGCAYTRDARSASNLPRLLFSAGSRFSSSAP